MYPYIKLIHVTLAILAVGANATYGVWIARAAREPEHLPHVLRGVKFLEDRVANPAYGLLLISGLVMVFSSGISIKDTPWLGGGMVLWFVAVLLAAFGFTPTLKRQIASLDAQGADSAEYQAASRRGMIIGISLAVLVLTIVFLMVVKPGV